MKFIYAHDEVYIEIVQTEEDYVKKAKTEVNRLSIDRSLTVFYPEAKNTSWLAS